MNVAEYLNEGWKPDWDDLSEDKYRITIEHRNIEYVAVTSSQGSQSAPVHFKTLEV